MWQIAGGLYGCEQHSLGPEFPAALALFFTLYAPECVEGKFCELRLDGVLRSSDAGRSLRPLGGGGGNLFINL